MIVDPMKLPMVASRTVTQLLAELECAKTPDRAALHISSVDHLAMTLALLADEHDVRIDTIPLRYSFSGRRIIGAGRKFHGGHAYVLVGNLLAKDEALAGRICRMIRNACISCYSPDALSHLAAEVEDKQLDTDYGDALSELRNWHPHTVTTA